MERKDLIPQPPRGRGRGRALIRGPPAGPPGPPTGPRGPFSGPRGPRTGPPQPRPQGLETEMSSKLQITEYQTVTSQFPTSSSGVSQQLFALTKEGSSGVSKQPSTSSKIPEKSEGSLAHISRASEEVEKTKERFMQTYRGKIGRPETIFSNYLRLQCANNAGVFEYRVAFAPSVDDRNERFRLLTQHKDVKETEKSFDGVKLFLPMKLAENTSTCSCVHSQTGETVELTIHFVCQKKSGDHDVVQFFNVLFNRIFRFLKFSQHNRKFYDAAAAHNIPQHKLAVWPGYVTAVDFFESELLIQVDVSHRVLRTETVHEVLRNIAQRNPNDIKAQAEKILLGCSVLTHYNSKTYKIDELDFNSSPKTTFKNSKGEDVSFIDYYKSQYGIQIKDLNQPLLVSRVKTRFSSGGEKEEKMVCLVPELCMMTGLTEQMRADFRIMQSVATFTRISPDARVKSMQSLLTRIQSDEKARTLLQSWGLHLASDPINIPARVLEPETLVFGNNYRERVTEKGDWNRAAMSKEPLRGVALDKWAVIYPKANMDAVRKFVQVLSEQARRINVKVANPKPVCIASDRKESYINEINSLIDQNVQLVLTVVPQQKSDRYATIKKLCCLDRPVPSQVVVFKTIANEKRLAAVAMKILLQINCKLGGELWSCITPFKGLMVVGIDVYHEKSHKSGSIAGVVASVNPGMSRYYSGVAIQKAGQELIDALKWCFLDAILKYYDHNDCLPSNIVIFRDGVGDGQMEAVRQHEIKQFTDAIKNIHKTTDKDPVNLKLTLEKLKHHVPSDYNPGFNFIVVQKRINTRLFLKSGPTGYKNPLPGSVVDHSITRYYFKDFFLVPQNVNLGTVTPTHFVVLEESGSRPLGPDQVQKLSYMLTHMYFNWPGTVRVPAPCQYAHKLVDLVGENLHQVPSPLLADKLYFL